jgi:hypothetical protein
LCRGRGFVASRPSRKAVFRGSAVECPARIGADFIGAVSNTSEMKLAAVLLAIVLTGGCGSPELPVPPDPERFTRELTPEDLSVLRAVLRPFATPSSLSDLCRESHDEGVRSDRL